MKGVGEGDAEWITAARGNGYRDVASVWRRAGVSRRVLELLVGADAFAGLGLSRREALWQAQAIDDGPPLPLFAGVEGTDEAPVALPAMSYGEEIVADYRALRLTLRAHPMALVRPRLEALAERAISTGARRSAN